MAVALLNLARQLERQLAERAGAPALLWPDAATSYAELDAWSAAIAAELRRRGVAAGDRVAVGLPNGAPLVAVVLAVLRAGAVLVPLNPNGTAAEARYAIEHSETALAVVGPRQCDEWAPFAAPTLQLDSATVAPISAANEPWTHRRDGDAALLMYTSGTTGRPKGVVLSHGAIATNLATLAREWRWTVDDRLLLTLPCFHLHGLALGVLGSLLVGSAIAMRERFVAEEVPRDMQRHRCTLFFGVPTMYNRLVQLSPGDIEASDLRSARLWVCGSAPLTAATFESFHRRYGHQILERFGMSEGGFMIAAPFEGPRRPGVVGVPLPGIDIRLIDPDAADRGDVVEVDDITTGEIAIRGDNLFSGYWRDDAATAAAYVGPYFRSGDLAVREADGMIRIVGRISVDVIKCRGFKIGAVEIENCLQAHPQIAEVAVVGVPHADLGEEIVAVVTPVAGAPLRAEDVLEYARTHLAAHKVPRRAVLMDEIPRTGPGKFKKRELIERLRRRPEADAVT